MAANPEDLEERVAFLERESERKGVIIDHLQAQSNKQLAAMNATMQTMALQIGALAEVVKSGFEQVAKQIAGLDKRHDHADSQFGEVRADIAELSNRVADIVKREGKK